MEKTMLRNFIVETIQGNGNRRQFFVEKVHGPDQALAKAIELESGGMKYAPEVERRSNDLPINFADRRRRFIIRENKELE